MLKNLEKSERGCHQKMPKLENVPLLGHIDKEQYEELSLSYTSYKKIGGVAAFVLLGSSILLSGNRSTATKVTKTESFEETSTPTTIGMWNEYTEINEDGGPIDLESVSYYAFLGGNQVVEPHRITTLRVFGEFDESTKFAWDIRRTSKISITSQKKPDEPQSERLWGNTIERVFATPGYNYDVKVTVYSTVVSDNGASLVETNSFNQKASCVYVRRELRALNHIDRAELLAAMWVPYSTPMVDGVEKYGEEYMDITSINDMHNYWAADFECDHLHDGAGFATQHLAITLRYEAAIQAINPKIVMPYWEYTIEAANIVDNFNNNFNKFYELSVVFSSDWFGPFDTQQEPWSEIEVAKSSMRSNSFGLARAPWNFAHDKKILRYRERCGFNTAKILVVGEAAATCDAFASVLEDESFEEFVVDLMHAPHGSIHIILGGIGGGCDHTYKDQLKEHFTDASLALLAARSATSLKALWRAGYVQYTSCIGDKEEICEQSCTGSDIEMGRVLWDWITPYAGIVPKNKEDSDAWLGALGRVICNTKLSIGDMYSSSATMDPLFWVMHTTTDRLMTYKRAKDFTFTDTTWSDSTCFGHSPGDHIIFDISKFVGSGSLLTNYDLLVTSDPKSEEYGLNYIYDSFDYSHCDLEKYPAFKPHYYPTDEELAIRKDSKKVTSKTSMLG